MNKKQVSGIIRAIIQRRNELGISQAKIASEINLRQATIAEWETGFRDPQLENVEKLVEALGGELQVVWADTTSTEPPQS